MVCAYSDFIVVNHGLKTVVYNYGMHTMCFAAGNLLQSMVYMCAIVNYGVLHRSLLWRIYHGSCYENRSLLWCFGTGKLWFTVVKLWCVCVCVVYTHTTVSPQ